MRRECRPETTGRQHVAFWPYESRRSPGKPHVLTIEEIERLREDFVAAARRARRAGFDIIDFHAAHGVGLFEQSLSPAMNKRTDKYGGDFGGRLRFSAEVVEAVKKEVGVAVPLVFRMPGQENFPGGNWPDGSPVRMRG